MSSFSVHRPFLVLALLLCSATSVAAADNALFPFLISYDAPDNIANVSSWLERPAGKHGHVRAEAGRLVTDNGPIRFWATNLCFEACFPTHDQADRVADRLARFGINCVRMHHMDARSIWGDSPNKLTIDPKRLDRLDYLVWALKQRGVYTNINLHVSRSLGIAEGFPARDERPKYDKGLGNFEPRMIQLQKKYARDLLNHNNPYTKTTYAAEPAVAFVEISNEDALFSEWTRRHLDNLPEPYAATFREIFNSWLKEEYENTKRLAAAWNVGARPPGDEMLANGSFLEPLKQTWKLERDEVADADWSVEADGPDGRRCLKIDVRRQGRQSWIPQLSSGNFAVEKGEQYSVTFDARCDAPTRFGINCKMDHEPWKNLGFSTQVDGTAAWQRYRFTFVANADDDRARLTLTNLRPGTYRLAAVSVRVAGITGLAPSERIEDGTVAILKRAAIDCTDARRDDFVQFLVDTERDYWLGMYQFLKQELNVKSLVSGTQLSYGPAHIQGELDYIDAHSYWMHPRFPNRPWDRRDWYVHNAAMVNDPPGTFGGLAARRVAGMAYTVSEYNHPSPIQYAAEGFPMIAAFGAFQRWDGIFSFAYSHNNQFEPTHLSSFFDIKGDPSRMAHQPACAAMFLRGDVAPAARLVTVPVSARAAREQLTNTLDPWKINAVEMGVDPPQVLRHAVAMDLAATAEEPSKMPTSESADTKKYVSDTGELRWDISEKDAGYFVADTRRTKMLTGFIRGREFDLGGVKLSVGKTMLDWVTITLTAIEGDGFDQPGRILIAATGVVQNSDASFELLDGDRITLRDRWGREPLLCEGIPASITLPVEPDRVTFYPLDPSGNRRAAAAVSGAGGLATIKLDARHRTIWYEVQIR